MSDMTLEWFEQGYTFFIAWSDNDGPGLALGQDIKDDGSDHFAATQAAKGIGDPTKGILGRLEWESESSVKRALVAARAAVKAWQDKLPMPDWALKATSEGWRAPRGWKPRANDNIVGPDRKKP